MSKELLQQIEQLKAENEGNVCYRCPYYNGDGGCRKDSNPNCAYWETDKAEISKLESQIKGLVEGLKGVVNKMFSHETQHNKIKEGRKIAEDTLTNYYNSQLNKYGSGILRLGDEYKKLLGDADAEIDKLKGQLTASEILRIEDASAHNKESYQRSQIIEQKDKEIGALKGEKHGMKDLIFELRNVYNVSEDTIKRLNIKLNILPNADTTLPNDTHRQDS